MQFEAVRAAQKDSSFALQDFMLDVNDVHACVFRCVDGLTDVFQGGCAVGDRNFAVEVFVLGVDHEQGGFGWVERHGGLLFPGELWDFPGGYGADSFELYRTRLGRVKQRALDYPPG